MSDPRHQPYLAMVYLTGDGHTKIEVLNGKFEEIGGMQGLAYDPKKRTVDFYRGSQFHSVPASQS